VRWRHEVRRFQPSTLSRRLSVVICFYRTGVIDAFLEHSPAAYLRRPSRRPGRPHWAYRTCSSRRRCSPPARRPTRSTSPWSRCSVCSGCPPSRRALPASATSARSTATRYYESAARPTKAVLVRPPPAVSPAIDRAVGKRAADAILPNRAGDRMDRHAATQQLTNPARAAGIRMPSMHPHRLRHTFMTTRLDAGISRRHIQISPPTR
jgi:integrase/recombinase XerD